MTRAVTVVAKPRSVGEGPGTDRPGNGDRESRRSHPTAQKILAAALKILSEHGYQRMTLQAISAEAKVNKAGVWYYFGGKQQLVTALLEELVISQSGVFGRVPPEHATLEERIDLFVGSAGQLETRVRNFSAFYALLPEASRDADLHEHLKTIYQAWYDWAAEVLSPVAAQSGTDAARLGEFASVLLDGLYIQMVVAAPGFDLEAAMANARAALMHLATRGTVETE